MSTRRKGPRCTVTRCPERQAERGCCRGHLLQLLATGSPLPADHPRNLCKLEDCWGDVKGNGYCTRHLQRVLKYGDPHAMMRREAPPCAVEGCEEPNWSLTYCKAHYARYRRHGDPTWTRERYCALCSRRVHGKGLCHKHYWRWWKHGDPWFDGKTYPECSIGGCYRRRQYKTLCPMHRAREIKFGHPLGGEGYLTGIDLPVEPLVRLIDRWHGGMLPLLTARGIEDQTEIDRTEMRYLRAKQRGAIDLCYADRIACELLHLHPALIWGEDYWQAEEKPTASEDTEDIEELMAA